MPPRPKFTQEEVLEKALDVVRAEGVEALTARKLGEALGSSPRPIFTLFKGMGELKEKLQEKANVFFSEFCSGFKDYAPAFKRLGMCMVQFAEAEPNLFKLLFMDKHSEMLSLEEWSHSLLSDQAIEVIMESYNLDSATATTIFNETWLHCYALCVLKVTGAATLTEQDVSNSLSRSFLGLLALASRGILTEDGVTPEKV